MATGAIVVSWGGTIPGREAKALEVFGRAVEQCEEYLKEGRIHGHKEFFPITGRTGGFQLIEGDVPSLQVILDDDPFRAVVIQAGQIVQDFRVDLYQGGSDASVQEAMGRFMSQLSELGYL